MIHRTGSLLSAVAGCALLVFSSEVTSGAEPPPLKDLASYVKWVQKSHKTPFDRDGPALQQGGVQMLLHERAAVRAARVALSGAAAIFHNVQVNQDRNPWPK